MTGSLNDPQGKGGLAHLLEHLAFKGTQNVKGEEFQRRLDQYTLMTNASTDYYSTRYLNIVRPDSKALNEVLYLEAERMDKLVLQQKFVPSEIEIVKREREIRLDQPFAVLMDQMWKSAYGNQYLGRLPIGDLEELKSIRMDELNRFYRTRYAPNNAVMVIAGKFDKAAILKRLISSSVQFQHVQCLSRLKCQNWTRPRSRTVILLSEKAAIWPSSIFIWMEKYQNSAGTGIGTIFVYHAAKRSSLPEYGRIRIKYCCPVYYRLDQDFNLVFMGAIYAPSHDENKVENTLLSSVEKTRISMIQS